MTFNTMNMAMSLAMLQGTEIPQEKKLAAAVGSALMPGILGLVLPLIVAKSGQQADDGSGTGDKPADGPVQTRVPPVQGKTEAQAIDALKRAGLTASVSYAYFKQVEGVHVPANGEVAGQEPKPSDEWIDVGSEVRLEVSLGSPPASPSTTPEKGADGLNQEIRSMGAKVDQILSKVGKGQGADAKH